MAIDFAPNWAQDDLLSNMHYFNVILKARQLGFTTLISLYFLDCCLFFDNHAAAVVAQNLDAATEIFRDKIKFAYDNLPHWLKIMRPLLTENQSEMEFINGSKICVGLSLRSGTFQSLHVSEFGKTSIKFPDKAKEIKTGAFNTVHQGQMIFVESTAEGQAGEFYELVKTARKLQDKNAELTSLDPKFFFYPWYENDEYALPEGEALRTVLDEETIKYFEELEKEHDIFLSPRQKAWYFKKSEIMGDEMMREFPSTPDESFAASVEGAIYPKQMRLLRRSGRITSVPWEPKSLVHTFWDFGNANYMAIWFFQKVLREFRMIRYHQDSGAEQGFKEYADFMRDLGYSYGSHYVPHDGATTRLLAAGNQTYKQMMESQGLRNIRVVPVTKDKWRDIEFVCKPALLKCWFDESNCAKGIKCLDNYRKEKNKEGVFQKEPVHDEYSDGSDAFRTFAVGYKEEVIREAVSFQLGSGQQQV